MLEYSLCDVCILGTACVLCVLSAACDGSILVLIIAEHIGVVYLSLPGRAERVIKGHLGLSEALLRVAPSLAGSGIGVWADMDQLVAEGPSLAALRVDCAYMLTAEADCWC